VFCTSGFFAFHFISPALFSFHFSCSFLAAGAGAGGLTDSFISQLLLYLTLENKYQNTCSGFFPRLDLDVK
jgi:hypothetical protein